MPDRRSFLLATYEGGGTVMPVLTVAAKLSRRGHRVRVMSDPCNRPESEAAGARFIPWQRAPGKPRRDRDCDIFRDWDAPDPLAGFLRLMDQLLVGPALAFAGDLLAELRREPADLVVSSEMLFGVLAGCEAARQRHALLAANLPLFPLPGWPPPCAGLPPARDAADTARHAAIAAEMIRKLDTVLPRLNAARAALGLPPLRHLTDQHGGAVGLLLATSRAFDFAPAVLPPRVHYVGPQLDDPHWAGPWAPTLPAETRGPVVLVSFSTTFQDHAGAVQRVIDALAGLELRALVTLGGSLRREELRGAANVLLLDGAPHHELLREAALVVTHGGHGTVLKALLHGRPLLILPHGRDQEDNAIRVTARGAGLALPRDAAASAIAAALLRLLREPGFAAAARRLGDAVARETAASTVAGLLEELAAVQPAPAGHC